MNRVLIISYNFPPDGSGAVQRVLKFCKYLPEFGWQPVVLTASGYSMTGKDPQLLEELSERVLIFRKYDFGNLIPGELRKLLPDRNIPDRRISWSIPSFKKAIRLIKKFNPDILMTTSPPHSTQLTGINLKDSMGIKWVADFRDEWSFNPHFGQKHKAPKQLQMELEVIRKADIILCNTPVMKSNFQKLCPDSRYEVITNGFDETDFPAPENLPHKENRPNSTRATIAYAGRLNELHSPVNFLNALNELRMDDRLPPLKTVFYTNSQSANWLDNFPSLLNNGIIKFEQYLPHQDCLGKLAESDFLLLLATNTNERDFVPGKFYEYLYLNRPILCLVPPHGYLHDLCSRFDKCYVCDEASVDSIKTGLLRVFQDDYKRDNSGYFSQLIREFSRRSLTARLSQLFDELTGR
ncbi:glycosyltransferase [bacterium]|nr:glycosyltransferase [bacterium]